MKQPLFQPTQIGDESFSLMDLTHPEIEAEIITEMKTGVAVYYDQRWEATGILTNWLAENLDLFKNKKVLILGAGVGAETLILGRHASHIYINDLAPTALKLCTEQLAENNITTSTTLLGNYQQIPLPKVDLVVASFLVYNPDTYRAMNQYMAQHQGDLILVNERLAPFPKLLKEHPHKILFEKEAALGVLFS